MLLLRQSIVDDHPPRYYRRVKEKARLLFEAPRTVFKYGMQQTGDRQARSRHLGAIMTNDGIPFLSPSKRSFSSERGLVPVPVADDGARQRRLKQAAAQGRGRVRRCSDSAWMLIMVPLCPPGSNTCCCCCPAVDLFP